MEKILLTIAYDGTNYFGWQRQKGMLSVQEVIESALFKLFGAEIKILGASRTDRGVHAIGQRASFEVSTKIPIEKMPYAINFYLPKDIVIQDAIVVSANFHPQYDAREKVYEYTILNSKYPLPGIRNYSQHIYERLNLSHMEEAAKHIEGIHDFKSFCASGSGAKSTIRTVYGIEIKKNGDIIRIIVRGNGFLYNMVRIIAGTLVYVGMGKLEASDIPKIIEAKNRSLAGKTLQPDGLSLIKITY